MMNDTNLASQKRPNMAELPLPMKHNHGIYHLLRRLICSSSLLIRGPILPAIRQKLHLSRSDLGAVAGISP
jgi:hypothetical protein